MTLYDYLMETDGEEVTVGDVDYDMTSYFYKDENPNDDWDKAIVELSKMLNVVEQEEGYVTVDLSTLIENHMGAIKKSDLFVSNDLDDIMYGMDSILAGNVSEKWMTRFVETLRAC